MSDLFNEDVKLTKTAFGVTMSVLTQIIHLRGIPKIELTNYHRILIIILLVVLFFVVYGVETNFI